MIADRPARALLAHPGTQYSAQLARQLARLGHLHRFWTGLGFAERSARHHRISRLLPGLSRFLHNRIIPGISADQIRIVPHLELGYLTGMRLGGESQRVVHWRNTRFQRAIPEREIEESDIGIGFDTSSLILIDRFHRHNKRFVVDQTIAHPRAKGEAYAKIRHQYPAWAGDLEERATDVSAAEDDEHRHADRIVAASTFTKGTLLANGIPAEKISVNPYGVDLERFRLHEPNRTGPLRFLFAGLISARKGIPLLLDAWRKLDLSDAELHIAGPISYTAPAEWLGSTPNVRYLGKLANSDLAKLMAESDVFVFPSYFEGFALVLLEAMACGLPVITTTATAGPDIVTEGEDGWIMPPGDLETLIEKMRLCADERDLLRHMRPIARATAERFSWNAFGDRWVDIIDHLN